MAASAHHVISKEVENRVLRHNRIFRQNRIFSHTCMYKATLASPCPPTVFMALLIITNKNVPHSSKAQAFFLLKKNASADSFFPIFCQKNSIFLPTWLWPLCKIQHPEKRFMLLENCFFFDQTAKTLPKSQSNPVFYFRKN